FPRLAPQLPPRTTLIRLTMKLGSRLRMIAVLTSNISTSSGVEMAGKPKPSAPCVMPARNSTPAVAGHSGEERISPESMAALPALQRVRPVAAAEAVQRLRQVFAQCDDLEQLAHFR